MNHYISFLGKLLLVVFLVWCIMMFLHSFPLFAQYKNLTYYSIIMFTLMSIILYLFLYRSLYAKDRQVFISITLINMFFRMAGSVVLLILYKNIFNPPNNKFIISFLIIYSIFTIFETYFMISIADKKHENN